MNLLAGTLKILYHKSEFLHWLSHSAYRFRRKLLFILVLGVLLFWLFLPIYFQRHILTLESKKLFKTTDKRVNLTNMDFDPNIVKIPSLTHLRMKWIQKKLDRMSKKMEKLLIKKLIGIKELTTPNYNVHAFYYAWFRNGEEDGAWSHWQVTGGKEVTKGVPPLLIDSKFYPKLDCYSSRNLTVVEEHMRMMKKAGIGVLILSWVPPSSPDSPKSIIKYFMDLASKYKLKVALEIDEYENRSTMNVLKEVRFFITKYGSHSAMYRMERNSRKLPVFYVHNTFQIAHTAWKSLLTYEGNSSIRGTRFDGIFLAHLSEYHHGPLLKAANFDGFYTYSASNGMSYGSTWKNWYALAKFASEKNLLFVPCVGPGYAYDKEPRTVRHRLHGNYYEVAWRSALTLRPKVIGITSFNNWQDGSQIEPAKPKKTKMKAYHDYEPEGPNFYLDLTLWWNKKFLAET